MIATPAPGADLRHGAELAQRWCASCHVVSPDQRQPTAEATPFATIGAQPSFDAARVALSLLAPHPRMPDMNLTRAEAEDLAAYMRSLGR
jgi:mono/diheme cytochrome c family protein